MCSQMIELRRRPAIGKPADNGFAVTALGAAKPRQPDSHRAEQRRHPMKPPVLDVTRLATRTTSRTQNRVIFSLHLDHHSRQACQNLLCVRQPHPEVRDIAERPNIRYADDPARTVQSHFNQAQDPCHPQPPAHNRSPSHTGCDYIPHTLDAPIAYRAHRGNRGRHCGSRTLTRMLAFGRPNCVRIA
jgi:hypothetical protein